MSKIYNYQSTFTDHSFQVTIGKVAEQADGECIIRAKDTMVLTTAVTTDEAKEGIDFFPLTCEYQEKMYAVGKIPGGYVKREGKGSIEATLNSRQIDRPIRPLFPEGFFNDVQIISTVLSVDESYAPEVAAMNGASIALSISKIPFMGPIGAVIVGYIDGKYVINPTEEEMKNSKINLTVAGTEDAIMMVEAAVEELTESEVLEAILFGHEEIKSICKFIKTIQSEIGHEKMSFSVPEIDPNLKQRVNDLAKDKLLASLREDTKQDREEKANQAKKELEIIFEEEFKEEYPELKKIINLLMDNIIRDEVRRLITVDKIRADGRKTDEVRVLEAETSFVPRAHGSGLFRRGQTQVLSVATLGGPADVQYIDGLHKEEIVKRYFHQYNFPPFSVGDNRPLRAPGRREIGHGNLAERALLPVLPTEEEFPYTIRVVSEVLSSNGSSSQASVCGSTLALMDAGVPIRKPVAGIAMGLVKEGDYMTILTDIQGLEDHLGDMDFKVAGTEDGITAIQMDIKIDGINRDILSTALSQAKKARLQILDVIKNAIDKPRNELSKYAPRLYSIDVDPEKVRDIIGKGGKTINSIIDATNVKIDTRDDGHIVITAPDGVSGEKALDMINKIVKEIEVGDTFTGTVNRIMKFGAFVDLGNGKEGMVHISKLSDKRIEKVEDVINIGETIDVTVIEIDDQGRVNLAKTGIDFSSKSKDNDKSDKKDFVKKIHSDIKKENKEDTEEKNTKKSFIITRSSREK